MKAKSVLICVRSALFFVAMFFLHMNANATTAKVVAVGTYGSGAIYVFFDTPISSCSTTAARIDLAADHPSLKNVLSVAEIAFSTGATVIINIPTCSGQAPIFTTDGASYFYLAK